MTVETTDTETAVESKLPSQSCDSHLHVFGPPDRFPGSADRTYAPTEMPLATYEAMAASLGLDRVVFVQPSAYGTDNRCQLEALATRPSTARAVIVIADTVSPSDLAELDEMGVRGVRLNLMSPRLTDSAAVRAKLDRVASRIADLGWHIQVYADLDMVGSVAPLLKDLPVPVVFDHMGGAKQHEGVGAGGFVALLELLATGRCWVKLSGADIVTHEHLDFSGATPFARALLAANPDRLVWGSDWPHLVHQSGRSGDDAPKAAYRPVDETALLAALRDWTGGDQQLRKILVDNPQTLYRF
tara:strand:- start:27821 stop:28720 length:900 start_codon:yes stop_codon:yes gene_type:complete